MDERDLLAKYKKMYQDGTTLTSSSSSITTNIADIEDLLSKDWNSWLGEDSDAYVASLKKNLDVLKKYASEIQHIGSYLQGLSVDYETALSNRIEELNSDE